jgi:hypothetical protein
MKATNGARVADDFTWHWLGARALIEGKDPYVVVQAGGQYDLIAPYIYPLTTAILIVPFALFLSPIIAAAVFVGLSTTLLAWGLTRDGYQRLPLFLSIPFLWAAGSGQFSPILAASALIPALGWLAPIKPQLGLATLAYRPSRAALAGSVAFVGVAFMVNPNWITEWRESLTRRVPGIYWMPVTVFGGPLLLLAISRWRRPEGRLLLILSLAPQLFLFYDQLLLWLIPRTLRESVLLSAMSVVALFLGNQRLSVNPVTMVVSSYAPIIIALLYLPCLIMLLRRPNEGEVPRWVERLLQQSRQMLGRLSRAK